MWCKLSSLQQHTTQHAWLGAQDSHRISDASCRESGTDNCKTLCTGGSNLVCEFGGMKRHLIQLYGCDEMITWQGFILFPPFWSPASVKQTQIITFCPSHDLNDEDLNGIRVCSVRCYVSDVWIWVSCCGTQTVALATGLFPHNYGNSKGIFHIYETTTKPSVRLVLLLLNDMEQYLSFSTVQLCKVSLCVLHFTEIPEENTHEQLETHRCDQT